MTTNGRARAIGGFKPLARDADAVDMRVVPCPSPRLRGTGLTLIELLVVIAIVGILAALAAPSMQDMLVRNRSATVANELISTVLRARNEAVNANACVVLCRVEPSGAANAIGPTPACVAGGAGTDWSTGWVAFRDPTCNANGQNDDAADGLPVIAAGGPFPAGYSLVRNGGSADRLVFSPTGNLRPGDTGRFDLRFQSTTRDSNRGICLNQMGRTRMVAYGAAC